MALVVDIVQGEGYLLGVGCCNEVGGHRLLAELVRSQKYGSTAAEVNNYSMLV